MPDILSMNVKKIAAHVTCQSSATDIKALVRSVRSRRGSVRWEGENIHTI